VICVAPIAPTESTIAPHLKDAIVVEVDNAFFHKENPLAFSAVGFLFLVTLEFALNGSKNPVKTAKTTVFSR